MTAFIRHFLDPKPPVVPLLDVVALKGSSDPASRAGHGYFKDR
jgi:hypothetical protein